MWNSSRILPRSYLYLNNCENCLQDSSASMYADDMHAKISARDIDELVQNG